MPGRNERKSTPSPLDALGVTREEEAAYRAVLATESSTVANVAKALGVSRRAAQQLLDRIEAKGMVTKSSRPPAVYAAAAPEFIFDAMIKQREAALESARAALPKFTAQMARPIVDKGAEQIVELITDRAKLQLIFSRMFTSMRSEAIFFQRAPHLIPQENISSRLPEGVRVRSISDASFLEIPGIAAVIRHDIGQGEEARSYPELPFKMMSIDRRIALITLVGEDPEGAVLLVHRSALLDALWVLFEFVWESATPVLAASNDPVEANRAEARAATPADALIPLLSAGFNDKTIARELGLSATTLNRRIAELMKQYHTRTRFQLGLRVAQDTARTAL